MDYREKGSHGFGVRVLPSGTKKFFYVYNIDGKRRFLNLGTFQDSTHKSGITLAEARTKFNNAKRDVSNGIDPLLEKVKIKAERNRTPFISDFINEYIREYAKLKTRGWKETERVLLNEINPRWGKWKITDVRKRDLILVLDEIKDRGSHVMANRTLAYVRKMFSYAVARDVLDANPFMGMPKPNDEKSRERALTAIEIRTFWANLDNADMSEEIKNALKLILITGQRPGEVIGINSCEIEGRWWRIPEARSKNGQAHEVYLSDMALKIIGNKKGYIFESPMFPAKPNETPPDPGKPYGVRVMTSCIKKNLPRSANSPVADKLKIPHFVPHDLRRTVTTMMISIGIPAEITDRVQNHITSQRQGVRDVYNRHDYRKEKQAALVKWAKKLNEIIGLKVR